MTLRFTGSGVCRSSLSAAHLELKNVACEFAASSHCQCVLLLLVGQCGEVTVFGSCLALLGSCVVLRCLVSFVAVFGSCVALLGSCVVLQCLVSCVAVFGGCVALLGSCVAFQYLRKKRH